MSDLTLTITITRAGGAGGEWSAYVDNGNPPDPGVSYGPRSSPGEVLEDVAIDLDKGETEAILAASRRGRR